MKKLTGVRICMVQCSILISSLDVICVAIQKTDKNDAIHILLNDQNLSLPTSQTTGSEESLGVLTEPTETSQNNTFTTERELQPHTRPFTNEDSIGDRRTDIYSTNWPVVAVEQEFNSLSGKQKESNENGLLTTTTAPASSLNPDIKVNVPSVTVNKTTLRIPTTNVPGVSKSLEEPFFTNRAEERIHDNVNGFERLPLSQFNTEEMLTTNPRTNNVQTGTEYSTVSLTVDDHSENTEQEVFISNIVSPGQSTTVTNTYATEASVSLDTENGVVKQSIEVNTLSLSSVSEFNEDWDDTKLLSTSQVKGHESITSVSAVLPQTVSTDPDHGRKSLIFTTPTDVPTEKIEDKVYTGTRENVLVSIDQGGIPASVSDLSSHVSKAPFTEEAGTTHVSTGVHDDKSTSTPLPGTVGHTSKEENEYKGFVTVSAEVVSVVSELANTLDGEIKQIVETASNTMATPVSLASSERATLVPSVKHFRTTEVYGLEKLESEEGEEEEEKDEDDDDEEEEEDDDEEDDEEKDGDSMDESVEGDTELPAFTLPIVSSREPMAIKKKQQLLEEVSYRVPDTLEWEQQNQGLVRSWMEKLKDKAGYMSGMLVPVGVGIAGALFILGALYSIKIMNRRRRLGFKRHKRKQREFNSMQDRVMLLADSSEDEF